MRAHVAWAYQLTRRIEDPEFGVWSLGFYRADDESRYVEERIIESRKFLIQSSRPLALECPHPSKHTEESERPQDKKVGEAKAHSAMVRITSPK